MKKYIAYSTAVLGILLGSCGIIHAAASINGINGQASYVTNPPTVTISVPTVVNPNSYTTVNTDPVVNVTNKTFIAHIQTPTGKIDVQRFIDPATNVACYYSEISNGLQTDIVPSCVVVSASAI